MNHWIIAPILLPLLTAVVLLAVAAVDMRVKRAIGLLATAALVALNVGLWLQAGEGVHQVYALGNWAPPFGIILVLDRLSAFMLLLTSVLALFSLLYAVAGTDVQGKSFHTLFQLQLMGLNGAFLTGDVFNLFVFFELLLIASYGLLVHGAGGTRSRAGFAYVVLNLVGSAVFLIALGILYGTLGTLNLADIAAHVQSAPEDRLPMVYVGALLLFSVFALKAGMVLLHYWLPPAYAAAQPPVAALFAIMTKVGIYAIVRVFGVAFPEGAVGAWLDAWMTPLGLATVIVGSLGMLAAPRLGKLIAYQVVASVGTLIAVFGLATEQAYAAGLYYLAHSTIATGLLFLLCGIIAEARGESGDRLHVGPVMNRAGLLALFFVIGSAAMVGLPPFSGFLGKIMVLDAARGSPYFVTVWVILLGAGLLNLIAWSRAGSLLFWKSAPTELKTPRATALAWGGVTGIALASLALMVFAGAMAASTAQTAGQIARPAGYVQDVLGQGVRR